MEFLDGNRVDVRFDQSAPIPPAESFEHSWVVRRDQRLALEDAVERGDHRVALQTLDATQRQAESSPTDLVVRAVALRHAGRLRDARDAVIKVSAMLEGSDAYPTHHAMLVGVDLDILQARSDDATASLNAALSRLPAPLHDWGAVLGARIRLQLNPGGSSVDEPEAFSPLGAGVLRDIRELIRDGALNADRAALHKAIELAEHNAMPVEAGEARLWLAGLQAGDERHRTLSLCRATLQRCGIRAWDARLNQYADETGQVSAKRHGDAALESLSQAEFRVADAVAGGLTNRQVAASLLISVKTVDFHLQQMYRKLGIRSRTELAVRMTNFDSTVRGDRQ
jgi:DNA-binding CsgD family transcriptional regulator